MDHMVIRRIASRADGTFGVASFNNLPFAVTVERPWADNKREMSCIPSGRYMCLRCRNSPDYDFKDSPKFGNTFQVYGVAGRSNILFHKGNTDDDSHGCIVLGEQFESLNGKTAVLSSRHAYEEFLNLTKDMTYFLLDIIDNTDVPNAPL